MSSHTNATLSEASFADQSADELAGKYLVLKLADEEYGIGILDVLEIIRMMDITRVPRSNPAVRGVINLRGRVIPVLDLRLRFGMDSTEATRQTVIVVVRYDTGSHTITMGLLVDEVLEVLSLDAASIEPPPDFGGDAEAQQFIRSIGKAADRVLFLLDIAQVLEPARRDALKEKKEAEDAAS